MILLLGIMILVGCRQSAQPTATPAPDAVQIDLAFDPDPPQAGEAALIVTLMDADGNAVTGAEVSVRGDMNHAGMVPELGEPAEATETGYRVPFNWSMDGDWIITVTAKLPDGEEVSKIFEVSVGS
jgi:hypothetical protein